MNGEGKTWIEHHRCSEVYVNGVNAFLRKAFAKNDVGVEMRCPCKKCLNHRWKCRDVIFEHMICNGVSPEFSQWIYETSIDSQINIDDIDCLLSNFFGDDLDAMLRTTYRGCVNNDETNESLPKGANGEARKFYRLIQEGKQPLYEGCKKFSTLSFMVHFYNIKCKGGMTENSFSLVMYLLKEAFPHANIPKSFNHAKNTIKDLGLEYKRIHACPNDCILYWGVNESEETCKSYGLSRWKVVEHNAKKTSKIAAKVMRYFSLKPRLQRLFMCKDFSQLMRRHAEGRKIDEKIRHAADGEAWKAMDANYPRFSSKVRNMRLGLASDGFNPFRIMGSNHSTWPIILVNYNLPPWLSMKAENIILSTLIPGPNSPGNNIDVYMQPLIAELKELWANGLETFDALTNGCFMMHASVLWTISAFPGLAMVSGYSTRGKFACPPCNYETTSMYLKHSKKMCYMGHKKFLDASHKYRFDKRRFDGKIEGESPTLLSGRDVEILLSDYVNEFGKLKRKRKATDDSPWRK